MAIEWGLHRDGALLFCCFTPTVKSYGHVGEMVQPEMVQPNVRQSYSEGQYHWHLLL